jgi:hypothetical protein
MTAIATVFIALFTLTLWLATDKLWRSGQTTFEATERAFVFLDGFDTELSTGEDTDHSNSLPERYNKHPELYIARFAVLPRWKNGGNTPTKKLTIQVDWTGPGVTPSFKYRGTPKIFFLAPRAAAQSDVIDIPPAPALIDWSFHPVGSEPLILIWGRADYEDVFGKKHFVEWCYQLRFSRPWRHQRLAASFIQWGDYNRSDESA